MLVVDDDPSQAELLCLRLRESGFAALCARGGVDALRQIAHRPPALIVLDLTMPGMDGFGVLDVLEASGHVDGLPIVVWTARGLSNAEQGALGSRVAAVLPKGETSLSELVEQVGRLVDGRTSAE